MLAGVGRSFRLDSTAFVSIRFVEIKKEPFLNFVVV